MPVIDSLVTAVLQPPGGWFWVPMRNQLADPGRRKKIASVVSCAPDNVTLLRRIDVAVWMHAQGSGDVGVGIRGLRGVAPVAAGLTVRASLFLLLLLFLLLQVRPHTWDALVPNGSQLVPENRLLIGSPVPSSRNRNRELPSGHPLGRKRFPVMMMLSRVGQQSPSRA
jgi:hypothetical protein